MCGTLHTHHPNIMHPHRLQTHQPIPTDVTITMHDFHSDPLECGAPTLMCLSKTRDDPYSPRPHANDLTRLRVDPDNDGTTTLPSQHPRLHHPKTLTVR